MLADGLALGGGELRRQGLVREQAEHGLLVRQFGAEAVHHADGALAVGLHQRVREVEPHQELLHAHAAVDQVDLEVALAQHAVAVLELFRRDDLDVVALLAEGVAEDVVLALARRKAGGTRRSRCWACPGRRTACTP